jgi:hypothetical protein
VSSTILSSKNQNPPKLSDGWEFFRRFKFSPHTCSSRAVEIHAVWGVSMKTQRTGVFPILHFLKCTLLWGQWRPANKLRAAISALCSKRSLPALQNLGAAQTTGSGTKSGSPYKPVAAVVPPAAPFANSWTGDLSLVASTAVSPSCGLQSVCLLAQSRADRANDEGAASPVAVCNLHEWRCYVRSTT